MKTYQTLDVSNLNSHFDDAGLSTNGKVQLNLDNADHNCASDSLNHAYVQSTPVKLMEDGTVAKACDYAYEIVYFIVTWAITNPDAEEAEDACDWSEYTIRFDGDSEQLKNILS